MVHGDGCERICFIGDGSIGEEVDSVMVLGFGMVMVMARMLYLKNWICVWLFLIP